MKQSFYFFALVFALIGVTANGEKRSLQEEFQRREDGHRALQFEDEILSYADDHLEFPVSVVEISEIDEKAFLKLENGDICRFQVVTHDSGGGYRSFTCHTEAAQRYEVRFNSWSGQMGVWP